jgi:hypothetical protein
MYFSDFNYISLERFNYFLYYQQVWTQKCAVQKASVDVISYYSIQKKNHGYKGPGIF